MDYRQCKFRNACPDKFGQAAVQGRTPAMNQFDGDQPPFEIAEPAIWRSPIIFNSPHSGSVYPEQFLSASRIDLAGLRRSEDSFMDELIGGLTDAGFPVVRVNFPRSYVDVNREPYELDPRCSPGGCRASPTRDRCGSRAVSALSRAWSATAQDIYRRRLPVEDALARIELALQTLSSRAAAANPQGPSDIRNGHPCGLPLDAIDRNLAR